AVSRSDAHHYQSCAKTCSKSCASANRISSCPLHAANVIPIGTSTGAVIGMEIAHPSHRLTIEEFRKHSKLILAYASSDARSSNRGGEMGTVGNATSSDGANRLSTTQTTA